MGMDTPFFLAAVCLLSALQLGLSTSFISPLQLLLRAKTGEHIVPVLKSLRWLPVSQRVAFTIPLFISYLARKVGLSRLAHNIMPPSVTGPPEFERAFRAHQNCVELYPIFLVTLWTCGMFFSEVTAAAGGLVYMIARQIYVSGYVKSPKKRLPGFYLTLAVLGTLSLLGSIGLLRGILHKYFHIHL